MMIANKFMRRYWVHFLIISSLLLAATAGLFIFKSQSVAAIQANSWNAGQIIDDGIFYNSNDMTVEQVQQFLNQKVPTCDTWGQQQSELGGGTRAQYGASKGYPAPFICLKNYYEKPSTRENNLSGKPIADGSLSAAQIIKNAAVTYGISVRALLVTIQKESPGPLVTDTWPFPSQYRNAMGFGCPDTAPCDPQYEGFTNQVGNAARQFLLYKNNPNGYRHKAQQNNDVRYNPASSCGSSNVFIRSTATAGLYNYTPYQPNQAALNNMYGSGDSCSAYGNRNFWRLFNDWFGPTLTPYAFKVSGSDAVYLKVNGLKILVNQMAILQDYGISPQSIQTIDQSTFDAIPSPVAGSGLSSTLGYIVKSSSDQDADGGSIYLISRGEKYQFESMQQFNDFGFDQQNITYMDLMYLNSLPGTSTLSNFISTPYYSAFQVSGGQKRIIFNYQTYLSINPSNKATPVSYYIADLIPSGLPISPAPVLIKLSNDESVTLLKDGAYYSIPDRETYDCWGFETKLNMSVYRLPQTNYISTISGQSPIGCLVNDGSVSYILSGLEKYSIPTNYQIDNNKTTGSVVNMINAIPTRQTPLKRYVKSGINSAVWFIDTGTKKLIPTYSNFIRLGLNDNSVDKVSSTTLSTVATSGIKLAPGQPVKSSSSDAVYGIYNNERVLYSTSNLFKSYKNNWQDIETYTQSDLDSSYPSSGKEVNKYYYSASLNKIYLFDNSACYDLNTGEITALGNDRNAVISSQDYDMSLFSNIKLEDCLGGSRYVKQNGQSLVYWIDAGKKHPLNTYTDMLNHNNGKEPTVIILSDDIINALTTSN